MCRHHESNQRVVATRRMWGLDLFERAAGLLRHVGPNDGFGIVRTKPNRCHRSLPSPDVGTYGCVLHIWMLVPLPWSEMSGFEWQTATPEEVDYQYSPSKFAKRPLDEYLEDYRVRSTTVDAAAVRQALAPLLIFIHGGYWQKLSAADSLFNGHDAMSEGIALHAVEYTLAPHASIAEMIDECIADITRTVTDLQPTRLIIAGSSAGAHLAAMCTRDAFIASQVDGVALLSGIYDVRPLVVTPTNDPLHLSLDSAADISPQLLPLPYVVPNALLAVGGHEPPEFIRQNAEFGERLLREGSEVQILVEEHLDHFDLPYDLLKRGTKVGDWCLSILKGSRI